MVVAALDWTVFVTAVSTLAVAGVGAFAGSRAMRIQTKGQLDQLRWERAEAERQARARIYVDFLNATYGLLTLTERQETITQDRFFAWVDDYTKCYNALLLAGVKDVSKSLTEFGPIQRGLFETLSQSFVQLRKSDAIIDDQAFDGVVRQASKASETERRDGIHRLVNIMRADVAPEGGSIYDVSADAAKLRETLQNH
jgi:hypothetical protein